MTGAAVDAFTADQPLNTDDHPVIEFINPKLVDRFQERGLTNLTALNEATEDVTAWVTDTGKGSPGGLDYLRNKVMSCLLEIRGIIKQI